MILTINNDAHQFLAFYEHTISYVSSAHNLTILIVNYFDNTGWMYRGL